MVGKTLKQSYNFGTLIVYLQCNGSGIKCDNLG